MDGRARDYRHHYQRAVAVPRLSRQGTGATGEALRREAGGYSGATSAIRRSGEEREVKERREGRRTTTAHACLQAVNVLCSALYYCSIAVISKIVL